MLYDTGSSNPVFRNNLEQWNVAGGIFKREGIYAYLWLIHVDEWQKPTQYCKAIILQLKVNKKTKTTDNCKISDTGQCMKHSAPCMANNGSHLIQNSR